MSTATRERSQTRYVYNYQELDRVPEGPCSARVAPRKLVAARLAPG